MAAGRHLGKFQMATSPERVVRSTSSLIVGGVFWQADRMDLLPVVPNARFGRPPSWKISNDHISGQHILGNLWSCGWRCHLSQMVTVQGNPRKAHTSSPTGLCLLVFTQLFSEVARYQSAKLARKQNLTPNSPSGSFKVIYFGVTGKAAGD